MPWLKGKVKEDVPGGDYAMLTNDPLFDSLRTYGKNYERELHRFRLKDPSDVARMKMTLKVYTNVQNGIYPSGLNMGESEGSLNLTKAQAFKQIILAQLEGNKDFSDYENWI